MNIVFRTRGAGFKATPLLIGRRLQHYVSPRPAAGPPAATVLWARLRHRPILAACLAGSVLILAGLAAAFVAQGKLKGRRRDRAIARKLADFDGEVDF